MLTLFYTIFALCCILLVVVGCHEFGHYVVARWCGVGVKSVVMGFGKPFFSKKLRNGVVVGIAPLPIGGYVKLFDEREAPVAQAHKHLAFNRQSALKRICILLAGPLINLLLAVFLFSIAYIIGLEQYQPRVGHIISGSIASNAKLKAGDEIVSIAGWQTPSWPLCLLVLITHANASSDIDLTVKRADQLLTLHLDLKKWQWYGPGKRPLATIGIDPKPLDKYYKQLGMIEAVKEGQYRTWQYIALNSLMLKKLLTGQLPFAALSGPFSMLDSAQSELRNSFVRFLAFMALLSIAVGMANLLPIPTLDGGHVLYIVIEKLRGKPVELATQVLVYRLMIAFFIVFFMHLIANDLRRYDRLMNHTSDSSLPAHPPENQAFSTEKPTVLKSENHSLKAKSHQ